MQLAHIVYFTLKEPSTQACEGLVDACHKYLKNHPGVVYFSAGTLVEELSRPVNDKDFHVSLNVVFQDKASHDQYQEAESHLRFIEENKESWAQVRVFDSYVR